MLLARTAQGFQTGEAGHAHVGDHHAHLPGAELFQGLFADVASTVSKPWLVRKESSRLRWPASSSTIRTRRRFDTVLASFRRHGLNSRFLLMQIPV